jgi:hypothetical protein
MVGSVSLILAQRVLLEEKELTYFSNNNTLFKKVSVFSYLRKDINYSSLKYLETNLHGKDFFF